MHKSFFRIGWDLKYHIYSNNNNNLRKIYSFCIFFFLIITCKWDGKHKSRLRLTVHFRSGEDSLENWFFFVLSLTVFKLNFIGQCYFINYQYYHNWFEQPARVTRMWEVNLGNCWSLVLCALFLESKFGISILVLNLAYSLIRTMLHPVVFIKWENSEESVFYWKHPRFSVSTSV